MQVYLLILFRASVLLLIASPLAFSQAIDSGQISGRVVDTTAASIPNARVVLSHLGSGFSRATISDHDGSFVLTRLPVGQ